MKYLLILNLFVFTVYAASGQEVGGLVFDDMAYDTLPRQAVYSEGSKGEQKILEGIVKKDLKPYCPRIRHQGNIGSCVGWSTGYGALTIQHAIKNGLAGQQAKITEKAFSALFVFSQIKIKGCSFGSKISDALKLLQSVGNIKSNEFDRNIRDCNNLPTKEELNAAKANQIADFVTLFASKADPSLKILKTKLSLVQNKPVVIGMLILKNFSSLRSTDKYWIPNIGDQSIMGGHAMVVVGFDESRQAFEVMNSWGEAWGNKGFIWIKYDDFAEYCKYGFQMSIQEKLDRPVSLKGTFALRTPKLIVGKDVSFDTISISSNASTPHSFNTTIAKSSLVQIITTDLTSGSYLYLFSVNTKGKVNIHFPRKNLNDKENLQLNESALITTSTIQLTLPEEQKAFSFEHVGTEHIGVLMSRKPIPDFHRKIKKMEDSSIAILDRIQSTFSSVTLAGTTVENNGKKLCLNSLINENKKVLVLLELKVK